MKHLNILKNDVKHVAYDRDFMKLRVMAVLLCCVRLSSAMQEGYITVTESMLNSYEDARELIAIVSDSSEEFSVFPEFLLGAALFSASTGIAWWCERSIEQQQRLEQI